MDILVQKIEKIIAFKNTFTTTEIVFMILDILLANEDCIKYIVKEKLSKLEIIDIIKNSNDDDSIVDTLIVLINSLDEKHNSELAFRLTTGK